MCCFRLPKDVWDVTEKTIWTRFAWACTLKNLLKLSLSGKCSMDAKLEELSVRWQIWIDPWHSINLVCRSFIAILGLKRVAFFSGSRKVARMENWWSVSVSVWRARPVAGVTVVVGFISVGGSMGVSTLSSTGVGSAGRVLGLPARVSLRLFCLRGNCSISLRMIL